MASTLQFTIYSACLFVLFGVAFSAVSPGRLQQPTTEQPAWAPATQPREFSYNIADGIKGANQIRHETWNNGTMTGMYAYPLGGNEWQVVNYIADDLGFRVTSSKKVSESELTGGHASEKDSASVDGTRDGTSYSYKVKASEIGQKQKQQQQQQQAQQAQQAQTQERNQRDSEDKKAHDHEQEHHQQEQEQEHPVAEKAQKVADTLDSAKNASASAAKNATSAAKNATSTTASKIADATSS